MPSNDEAAGEVQILNARRQIQDTLGRQERPLARACGLTEREFPLLADIPLIEVSHFADEGEDLDVHRIESILPGGAAILAAHPISQEPVKVIVEPPKRSKWTRVFQAFGTGLWDVIKLAIGAGFGLFAGWILWKKHWH